MADANEMMGENNHEEAAESPTAAQPEASTTPPAEENSAVDFQVRVPKSRLDEVIHQRNRERELADALRRENEELKARQSGGAKSNVDALAARFVSELGMGEEAARKMAVIQLETSESMAKAQTQQLREQAHRQDVDSWGRAINDKYGDYKTVAPAMEKLWSELPPQTRDLVVSSQAGLEMLYHRAKADLVDNKAVYEKGVNAGYENKGLKKAISSVPSMGANGGKAPISREYLQKISTKEFIERKGEIDAWLSNMAGKR